MSPAFLGQVVKKPNHALVGLVVVALLGSSIAGQTLSTRLGLARSLQLGCVGLVLGMVVIGASLPTASLALLIAGAVIAGLGQGLSFRAGLGSVTSATQPDHRGEVTSTFFTALYVGISLPVIGEGALASGVGLVSAGVTFAALVAALSALALVLLLRAGNPAAETAS